MRLTLNIALMALGMISMGRMASASVTGTLDLSAGANTVTVTGTTITWNGDFTVSNTTTLTYDGGLTLPGGTQGVLKNLPPNPPVLGFITFPTVPTLVFNLGTLGPGDSNTVCTGLAVGDSCSTFAGSPFVLTRSPTGTDVSLSADGTVIDGTLPISTWMGQFTEPITGLSPAAIQAIILSGNSITKPYSGEFVATIEQSGPPTPEPGTMSLLTLAGGCLLFALFGRKRSQG